MCVLVDLTTVDILEVFYIDIILTMTRSKDKMHWTRFKKTVKVLRYNELSISFYEIRTLQR